MKIDDIKRAAQWRKDHKFGPNALNIQRNEREIPSGITLADNISSDGVGIMYKQEPLPTAIGKEKYEPDGFYEGYPCTCTEECDHVCKGECGCEACHAAWQDDLSFDF